MRKISQEHLDAYKSGLLAKLFTAINEDPELSFEIRMKDEVMVYYHKDKILTTKFSKGQLLTIKPLDDKYYSGISLKKSEKSPNLYFSKKHRDYTLRSLTEMRKYFALAKRLVHAYKLGLEFEVQQNIALGNRSFDNRFLVVDMEWMFPQTNIQERISKTRIDLVAIDNNTNANGFNDIYLVELKVGLGATEGKSGTIDHVRKTNEIINKTEACKALNEDISNIIKQKTELGIFSGTPIEYHLAPQPKMMIILAYRGEEEKVKMMKEVDTAQEYAASIGMDKPICVVHNALITLNYPK